MTTTALASAPTGHDDQGRVLVGHDAVTGAPVHYLARTATRLCNGLISGRRGVGKTTLAGHIADALGGTGEWTIRRVDADDRCADAGIALDALSEAEWRAANHRRTDLAHLLVWDGVHRLTRDPVLRAAQFARWVAALAEHGPDYGIAQLAVTDSLLAGDFGGHTRLRGLLADNVLALSGDNRAEQVVLGGATITPADVAGGHAYAVVDARCIDPAPAHAHVHAHVHLVTGPGAADCDACWRVVNDRLATDHHLPRLAVDPVTGLAARRDERGRWRWLDYLPGPALSPRQIADLRPYTAPERAR